ncbi:MAG: hypothetical protein HKP52_10555 [Desulfofustis sp.]|nr:hypothetical protein [Desulfofustis sp.]
MINDKKLDRMYDDMSKTLDPDKIRSVNRDNEKTNSFMNGLTVEFNDKIEKLEIETKAKEEGLLNFLSFLVMDAEKRKLSDEAERKRYSEDTERQRLENIAFQKDRDLISEENIKRLEALSKAIDKKIESLGGGIKELSSRKLPEPEKVDLSPIINQLGILKKEITTLKNKKVKTHAPVDLSPVIAAITEPREVEFSIEYDQWDYPIKITAREK